MRNVKALGLVLVAAFAMSLIMASMAQADKPAAITIEGGSGLLTGKHEEGTDITLTRDGRTVTCHEDTLTATVNNKATTITAVPKYSNCTSSLGGPVTITMNSCYFVFHLTADAKTPPEEDTWTATADLECENPNDRVYIHVYSTTHNHTTNVNMCTYEFGPQTSLEKIEFTNKSADAKTPQDWITADIEIKGIKSKRTAGSTLICGAENNETGELHGVAEIKGENHAGEGKGITISTH